MLFVEGLGIFSCVSLLVITLVMCRRGYKWEMLCLPKKSRVLEIEVPRELNEDEVEVYVDEQLKLMANNGNSCALDIIKGYVQLKFD